MRPLRLIFKRMIPSYEVDTNAVSPHKNTMDSVVVKCAFCPARHVIKLELIDTWFVQCDCGARGFIEDDHELMESGHGGPGFTVRESSTMDGRPILLSDPHAVFVDEWACMWHVSWYLLMAGKPDGSQGVWHARPGDDDTHQQ